MTYSDGVTYMKLLTSKLKTGESKSFSIGQLVINYPGYKKNGDYQVTIQGTAPKHTDIVQEIYNATNVNSIESIIAFLDDVYTYGLNATHTHFSKQFKEKIYWITLQEEINYPQPRYKGRKLPFQRYYEAAIAKVQNSNINTIYSRTDNHGKGTPQLYNISNYTIPSFYK